MNIKKFLWNEFCERQAIPQLCVPLFKLDESGNVERKYYGRDQRPILVRSSMCESMIQSITETLVCAGETNPDQYDGILYMIGWMYQGKFIPLYIGTDQLRNRPHKPQSKQKRFAGWGDDYGSHIGNLSACVLPGHSSERKSKTYRAWAKCFFSKSTQLKREIFFWAMPWKKTDVGIWEEFGACSLEIAANFLTTVAKQTSPYVLN